MFSRHVIKFKIFSNNFCNVISCLATKIVTLTPPHLLSQLEHHKLKELLHHILVLTNVCPSCEEAFLVRCCFGFWSKSNIFFHKIYKINKYTSLGGYGF